MQWPSARLPPSFGHGSVTQVEKKNTEQIGSPLDQRLIKLVEAAI